MRSASSRIFEDLTQDPECPRRIANLSRWVGEWKTQSSMSVRLVALTICSRTFLYVDSFSIVLVVVGVFEVVPVGVVECLGAIVSFDNLNLASIKVCGHLVEGLTG